MCQNHAFCYFILFFLFKQYLKLDICSKSIKLLILRAYVVSRCGYILSHGRRLTHILKEAKKEKNTEIKYKQSYEKRFESCFLPATVLKTNYSVDCGNLQTACFPEICHFVWTA